ncbi:heavy-metal-associated domain-containing protein [Deinococcus frigens]|uniref:heavy-metal-associated domain-containing protein n=1 Tax=Deinococcus frigens TaxID=249403 RepID=UPI00316ACF47
MSHDAGQTVAVALPSVPQAIPNDGQIEIPYPPSQLTVLDQGRAVGGQSFLAGMS